MKATFSLFRVLFKNTELPAPKEGTKGNLYRAMGVIAISCIMIPCCFIVGYISYFLGYALINVNVPMAGLQAEIHIMSACSMIFGILVIFNLMFFSSDREHLVPLPFRSEEILAAKFFYSYVAESVMEFFILLSMFIGFFIAFFSAVHFQFFSLLAGLIGIVLIPLLPLTYCAILSLLLMAILKNLRSGRALHHISTILSLLFIGLFLLSFRGMDGITVDNYLESLANQNNLFTNILDKVFFTVPLLLKAIEKNSFLYLLLYILGNVAVVALMLLLGRYLYQPALHTVARLGSTHHFVGNVAKHTKQKTVLRSYVQKEIRVLLRTKAYAVNCVFVNLLWPFAIVVTYFMNRDKEMFQKIIALYQSGNERMILILLIGVILVSFIASTMNSLASTAFTREGAHISIIKYIPVSYEKQWKAKALVTVIFSAPPLLLSLLLVGIIFSFSPMMYLICLLLICFALCITTMEGLYLDSAHPYSSWDDEYSALRGNLNSFYNMAMIMVVSILICAIGFILYALTGTGLWGTILFYLISTFLLAVALLLIAPKKIVANMQNLY